MYKLKKFSSQMDEKTLKKLREYSKETQIDISVIITEAVEEFIESKYLRPKVLGTIDDTLDEYEEDLKELAK